MAKGISLHIGLNSVDPKHYQGWNGQLAACEFDANDMQKIAKKQKFVTQLLLTKKATYDAVTNAIQQAALKLQPGDIFVLSYSGHGGQVPDKNGDDEEDGEDETWVLFDREIVDDELYALWGKFQTGVRILMFSDSCHSGTVSREVAYRRLAETDEFGDQFKPTGGAPRFRLMPRSIQDATYRKNKKLYDKVQRDHAAGERVAVGATVILISGCQDGQLSSDGDRNGAFTEAMKRVWDSGAFKKNYRAFHKAIAREMPIWQQPNFFRVGPANPAFERQIPFTI